MIELLQYRRYVLPFRVPMRTAHGAWTERTGVIVRREDAAGNVGYGEVAPIPGFGPESLEEGIALLASLGSRVETERLAVISTDFPCLRQALTAASPVAVAPRCEAKVGTGGPPVPTNSEPEKFSTVVRYLPIAALLPAGRAALEQIGPKADAGFRTFKWKVGVGDVSDELALLDDLCGALPTGAKLRLDANGAWERRQAERWLERCADRPIEHVEQPCFADAAQGASRQAKVEDMLLGLAGDYPTPLALDESLVNQGDIERWLGLGWPGVFVVKPMLLAEREAALAQLAAANAKVVFSSALETGIGAKSVLRTAFQWAEMNRSGSREGAKEAKQGDGAATSGSPHATGRSRPQAEEGGGQSRSLVRALGFGVWPLFVDRRFDGPAAAPFVYRDDVERIDSEAIWNALS